MAQDTTAPVAASECEVMASVDSDSTGDRLIIAELCRDDAYLSMSMEATVDVTEWR